MDMRRPNYVCPNCLEHFTRKYSTKRHNITVHHNNGGEIVPLVEYLLRRSTGQYHASHPSWYRRSSKEKRIHNFRHATAVADSAGDTFRPRGLQRQQQVQYQQSQERYQQSISPSSPADQPPSPAILVYWIWVDQTMCVQPVQNTSQENTVLKDTILLYTTTT